MQNSLAKTIGKVDEKVAAQLVSTVGDITLVVDKDGIIREVTTNGDIISERVRKSWLGKAWRDTVTPESVAKVDDLLANQTVNGNTPPWRQVNHPIGGEADIPLRYCVFPLNKKGQHIVIGRDLRPMARLQQRLMDAQQSMERDYARLRYAETRYRLLFQLSAEAILIVDAATMKVVEANPAATSFLGKTEKQIVNRAFLPLFDAKVGDDIKSLLASTKSGDGFEPIAVRAAKKGQQFYLSASVFRQNGAPHYLVRLSDADSKLISQTEQKFARNMLDIVERLPDGFVVTDTDWHVVTANSMFLDLAQLASKEQAQGIRLDKFIGQPGVDFRVLTNQLREHGAVRRFVTTLNGEFGAQEEVEVSAVYVDHQDFPCYGFTIRNVDPSMKASNKVMNALPQSPEQLTELVGRVPLKDLVRDTTDLIERLCIEAALELTDDNRASAAELLGLSRQSLYTKLRRHGLGDLDSDSAQD